MSIPKTIHCCWFGNNPKGGRILRCMESWREFMPDFEIKEWNEGNCDIGESRFTRAAYEAGVWALVADYFRFKVLYEHGGIYLDTDMLVHRPLGAFLQYDAFFAMECYEYVCGGIIGAAPKCEVIRKIFDGYNYPDDGSEIKLEGTVCHAITKVLLDGYGYKQTGVTQFLSGSHGGAPGGIAVFSPNVMIINVDDGENFCEHLYDADVSWFVGKSDWKNGRTWKYEVLQKYFRNLFERTAQSRQVPGQTAVQPSGMQPKVIFRSVARNAEKTLRRTVESVFNQTHTNWELHLVNNDSTDSTGAIMEEYAKKDPRVRVFTNEGNYVWKKGNRFTDYYHQYDLENTYMCHIDADDEYKPNFAEDMLKFAGEYNLDIACCGYEMVNAETGQVIDLLKTDSTLIIEGDGFGTLFPMYHRHARFRVMKLFKLTVTGKVVPSENVDILHGGDTAEALEYFRVAGRVGICPETYYIYYYYPDSIGKKWWASRPADDRKVHDLTVDFLTEKAGWVSPENFGFLREVFFNAVNDMAEVLLSVDLPPAGKLATLHDIFTHRYTLDLVDTSPAANRKRSLKDEPFKAVAGWVEENSGLRNDEESRKQADEILSALRELSEPESEIELTVRAVLQNECARSVLEISGFDSRYGKLCKNRYGSGQAESVPAVDRIDLTGGNVPISSGVYGGIYGSEMLSDISEMKMYDVIIVLHLFENMAATDAKAILDGLLTKADKQVLVITPEYPYDFESGDEVRNADVRAYHPIFFLGMDFCYAMLSTDEGNMQAYSFFPKAEYEPLPVDRLLCDEPPEGFNTARKLKIAYVIGTHAVKGGMKAVYAQMKALAKRGHHITAYYRSGTAKEAVPGWSGLTGDDVKAQVVIPEDAGFNGYITGADIIILSKQEMVIEFMHSEIPVAVWEQGSQALFGDYEGKLFASSDPRVRVLRNLYNIPAHLLAVSETVQTILREVYCREAQVFPAGIDTDFYCPLQARNPQGVAKRAAHSATCDDEQNEIPVVLLAGNPTLKFKGMATAFQVLEMVHKSGIAFKARLATQTDFALTPGPSYDLEIVVNPAQEKLAEMYRNADVFLSTSLYESFSLPPLEAMASGTAVVATDCGGINAYAEPGVNCLLCEQGDIKSMHYALAHLLTDRRARELLGESGRETALRFSHQSIAPELERCLYRIAGIRD